jgi:hypothetical protein
LGDPELPFVLRAPSAVVEDAASHGKGDIHLRAEGKEIAVEQLAVEGVLGE